LQKVKLSATVELFPKEAGGRTWIQRTQWSLSHSAVVSPLSGQPPPWPHGSWRVAKPHCASSQVSGHRPHHECHLNRWSDARPRLLRGASV